jgi:hypothetical protein
MSLLNDTRRDRCRWLVGCCCCPLAALLVVSLLTSTAALAASECSSNDQCVPATCCHAAYCVPRGRAPKCSATEQCSEDCQPFTIDCGGKCLCDGASGKCEAQFGHGEWNDGHRPKKKVGYYKAKVPARQPKHGG